MATPHINAKDGAFADTVLMPGDPLRAKYIAETFLENVEQVCDVRSMLGFTGTYKGRRISVMGHGMGIPSCSIYATELIKDYGVKTLIRVGSCGAVREDVKLRDVVIGMGACTDSKVNRLRFKDHDFAAIADFDLVANAVIFHNVVDQTRILRELKQEGFPVNREDVATLSPYVTSHIKRFGDYIIDLDTVPEPIDSSLPI